jgi:hypothetical protein
MHTAVMLSEAKHLWPVLSGTVPNRSEILRFAQNDIMASRGNRRVPAEMVPRL